MKSYQLESNQNSYQNGLHEGRASRARAVELGTEPRAEPSIVDVHVGDRRAYLRGYRAGLNGG